MAQTAKDRDEPAPRVAKPLPLGMRVPKEGDMLVVELPGERLRSEVARVVSPDVCIVELTWPPMSKSHSYQHGDMVPVRRAKGSFGEEIWESFRPQAKPEEPEVPKMKPKPTGGKMKQNAKKAQK